MYMYKTYVKHLADYFEIDLNNTENNGQAADFLDVSSMYGFIVHREICFTISIKYKAFFDDSCKL